MKCIRIQHVFIPHSASILRYIYYPRSWSAESHMLQTNMWQAFLCLVSKDSHTPSTWPRFNKKDSMYANSQSCSEQTTSLGDIHWNLRSPRNFPGGKFSLFWRCQCYKGATSGSHMLQCLICLEDPNSLHLISLTTLMSDPLWLQIILLMLGDILQMQLFLHCIKFLALENWSTS